jgi:hypothetical protein
VSLDHQSQLSFTLSEGKVRISPIVITRFAAS